MPSHAIPAVVNSGSGASTSTADGTKATTVTPGAWYVARMLESLDAVTLNIALLGKGNTVGVDALGAATDPGGNTPFAFADPALVVPDGIAAEIGDGAVVVCSGPGTVYEDRFGKTDRRLVPNVENGKITKIKLRRRIAFGPALSVGLAVGMLCGETIIKAYLSML